MIFAKCRCCNNTVKAIPKTKGHYCLDHGINLDDQRFESGFEVENKDGKVLWLDANKFNAGFYCIEEIASDSEKPNN